MSNTTTITDRRLLAALDYIDQKYIDDVFSIIKEPEADTPVPVKSWRTPLKHSKLYIALAASLLLLSMASPLVNFITYMVSNFTAGAGSGTTEEISEDIVTDENGIPYTYPMFVDDLELLTVEEILRIDELWYKRVYDNNYKDFYDFYINNVKKEYSESEASELADIRASRLANKERHCFFNEQYYYDSRYYGKINDCVILVSVGLAAVVTEYKIAGYTISFSTSAEIYAIKDNDILSLEEAYDLGYLTDENIALISERHNAYKSYLKNSKTQGE